MSLAHDAEIVKRTDVTHDAFLGGRLTITQPAKGFRAGLDSVLLGAAVGHHPALIATLVESDPALTELALTNIAANGLAARADVLGMDLTASGRARASAGLAADSFVSVIANPPFFTTGRGTRASARGAAARHMTADQLDRGSPPASAASPCCRSSRAKANPPTACSSAASRAPARR